jgi:hypothetical protein
MIDPSFTLGLSFDLDYIIGQSFDFRSVIGPSIFDPEVDVGHSSLTFDYRPINSCRLLWATQIQPNQPILGH